jgi:3-oxoacyl-[acyl-carrier-protein] synthase III
VPHQANLRIISATAKKLGMSMDNVVVTLDRHGNTSAASVLVRWMKRFAMAAFNAVN